MTAVAVQCCNSPRPVPTVPAGPDRSAPVPTTASCVNFTPGRRGVSKCCSPCAHEGKQVYWCEYHTRFGCGKVFIRHPVRYTPIHSDATPTFPLLRRPTLPLAPSLRLPTPTFPLPRRPTLSLAPSVQHSMEGDGELLAEGALSDNQPGELAVLRRHQLAKRGVHA